MIKNFICENPDCNKPHDGSYGSGRFCSAHCKSIWIGKKANQTMKSNNNKPNNLKNYNLKNKKSNIKWTCKHCHKIFDTRRLLNLHRKTEHADIKRLAWNKGLTKETDIRIDNAANKLKARYSNNEIIPIWKNKKHSAETKEKMRQHALNATYQRVCKKTAPYYNKWMNKIVKLDSSYEVTMAKLFDENNIEWIRPNPIKWIDKNKVTHNYFPDFYLVQYNLFVDPKNDYCFKVQSEKIECLKHQYSNIIFLTKEQLNLDFLSGYTLIDAEQFSK